MSYIFNKKIAKTSPYEPESSNCKCVLNANESFIALPLKMRMQMANVALDFKFNRYPDPYAVDLVFAFSKFHNIPIECIVAGNGTDELISVIISCFLMKNEKILTLSPDFSMYKFYSSLYEVKNIELSKDLDYEISADQIIEALKSDEKIRMLIFSNPCNPTGQGMEQIDIIKILDSTDALVVVDEAYMDFWGKSVIDETQNYDNLIVLKTLSKALGVAALRLGFAIADEKIIDAIKKVKSPYNVNGISQKFGQILLNDWKYINDSTNLIAANALFLFDSLKLIEEKGYNIHVFTTKANFVLVSLKNEQTAELLHNELIKRDICVRHLLGNCLRITAGTLYECKTFSIAFEEVLASTYYLQGENL